MFFDSLLRLKHFKYIFNNIILPKLRGKRKFFKLIQEKIESVGGKLLSYLESVRLSGLENISHN